MPVTAALIASGVMQGAQGIQSLIRARRAKKEIESLQKNLKEPNFEMPAELMQVYSSATNMPLSRNMPGYGAMQNMIGLQQSGAMGDIAKYGSGLDAVAAATNLGTQGMAQQQELGVQNANFYNQRLDQRFSNMMSLAPMMAQYRNIEYTQNELNPFLRTSAAISALREKRYRESNNALDSFAQLAQTGVSGFESGVGSGGGSGGGDVGSMGVVKSGNAGVTGRNTGSGSGMGSQWKWTESLSPDVLFSLGLER